MAFERCIYFNTNALARKLNARWEQAFARFDLPPSHGYLVRLVLQQPGLSQQAIADELRLEKSTVARFLSLLEEKNLIERRQSDENKREKLVYPTEKAREIGVGLEELGAELYAMMQRLIGKKNVKAFVASIREVAEKV